MLNSYINLDRITFLFVCSSLNMDIEYAQKKNKEFKEVLQESYFDNSKESLYGRRSRDVKTFRSDYFKDLVNDAYNSRDGYSISKNPDTGELEMFIAGSRNEFDWKSNAYDYVAYNSERYMSPLLDEIWKKEFEQPAELRPNLTWFDVPRKYREWKLGRIARNNNIQVIYGHSRGGAILADMNAGEARKVGLDAAMSIADNLDMQNYFEFGIQNKSKSKYFDQLIGYPGRNNEYMNLGPVPHQVWN